MISLKDLKSDILNNKFNHFYVFYGDDYGLRQHYIERIAKNYTEIKMVDNVDLIRLNRSNTGLFVKPKLYVVYNDVEFLKLKPIKTKEFIDGLKTDCVIVTYDTEYGNSTLFKNFSDYITYFPTVQENIAFEFIDSEITISQESKIELARNCGNNYSKICIESDKIRNYAQAKNVNEQIAFDELTMQKQLLYEYPKFKPDDLMDDVLQGNFENLGYWSFLTNEIYKEEFWIMLNSIFNNYIIAYLIVRYGKYEGSTIAFNYGLPWYRTKTIREFKIPYDADYLLECAYDVAGLDKKVKSGQVPIIGLFDYFLTTIL